MKTITTIILSSIMGLGLYAMYDATMKARVAEQAQIKHSEHCLQVKMLILSEIESILATGKFPTASQQDEWAQLTMECPS